MAWMQQAEQFAESLFRMMGNIALAFMRRLAPFAVPAVPAIFFGHSVYRATGKMGSQGLAPLIGVVAALGLESAGILGAHIAVQFYASGDTTRGRVAVGITALYIGIGITGILFLDNTTLNAKVTGVMMFLIAGMVYVLLGLVDEAERQRQAAQQSQAAEQSLQANLQTQELAHRQEMERLRQQQRHERRLRQLELAEGARRASTEPAVELTVSQHVPAECDQCGRTFGSVQALNAHKRFCQGMRDD